MEFVKASSWTWVNGTASSGRRYVTSVDYFLSSEYAGGMFNSCRSVQFPSSNGLVMSLLCGRKAALCSPQVWLKFLGDKQMNPSVPFEVSQLSFCSS